MRAPNLLTMADVMRDVSMTLTVETKRTRLFKLRLYVGGQIVRLGARVIGLKDVWINEAMLKDETPASPHDAELAGSDAAVGGPNE